MKKKTKKIKKIAKLSIEKKKREIDKKKPIKLNFLSFCFSFHLVDITFVASFAS